MIVIKLIFVKFSKKYCKFLNKVFLNSPIVAKGADMVQQSGLNSRLDSVCQFYSEKKKQKYKIIYFQSLKAAEIYLLNKLKISKRSPCLVPIRVFRGFFLDIFKSQKSSFVKLRKLVESVDTTSITTQQSQIPKGCTTYSTPSFN